MEFLKRFFDADTYWPRVPGPSGAYYELTTGVPDGPSEWFDFVGLAVFCAVLAYWLWRILKGRKRVVRTMLYLSLWCGFVLFVLGAGGYGPLVSFSPEVRYASSYLYDELYVDEMNDLDEVRRIAAEKGWSRSKTQDLKNILFLKHGYRREQARISSAWVRGLTPPPEAYRAMRGLLAGGKGFGFSDREMARLALQMIKDECETSYTASGTLCARRSERVRRLARLAGFSLADLPGWVPGSIGSKGMFDVSEPSLWERFLQVFEDTEGKSRDQLIYEYAVKKNDEFQCDHSYKPVCTGYFSVIHEWKRIAARPRPTLSCWPEWRDKCGGRLAYSNGYYPPEQ